MTDSPKDVAKALRREGMDLLERGSTEDAVARFDEILDRFGDTSDAELRDSVALALYDKAWAFECANRHADAIAVDEELEKRFGHDAAYGLARRVADGLLLKGNELTRIGLTSEALTVYDDIVARYGARTESALRESVAIALVNKAAFVAQRRRALAIPICDEILARFGDATEPLVREQVANALVRKAHSLEVLKRDREALAVHHALRTRFAVGESPKIDDLLTWSDRRCDVMTSKSGYKTRRELRRRLGR
jgi:tetratricopeptide (TPR) repeat protein